MKNAIVSGIHKFFIELHLQNTEQIVVITRCGIRDKINVQTKLSAGNFVSGIRSQFGMYINTCFGFQWRKTPKCVPIQCTGWYRNERTNAPRKTARQIVVDEKTSVGDNSFVPFQHFIYKIFFLIGNNFAQGILSNLLCSFLTRMTSCVILLKSAITLV